MHDQEKQIRQKIAEQVKEYFAVKFKNVSFEKGKSRIPYAGRVFDEKELVNLVESSLDFWLTTGRYAAQFEEGLAKFLNVKYSLLTNSGSSANLLAISALTSPLLGEKRLKPGDEVITAACGFPTTVNPIIQNQLVPVFVDVEIGTYNADVAAIEAAITPKTKAIFLAHTLGNPFNLAAIKKIADTHGIWLVEDNCDALGSKFDGKYTGTFGQISTCSFYPAHHMTMGEGGAVNTNDPLLKRIIASFRDWGRDCWCDPGHDDTCKNRFKQQFGDLPFGYDHKYVYSHIGYNLKVTDMQAAIGVAQLEKLPRFIEIRKKNFSLLTQGLKKYEKYLILPFAIEKADPSWFGFPITVRENAPFNRNTIVEYLEKQGIATRMLFGGNLVKQPAYKDAAYRIHGTLENTDRVMNDLFWIGVYQGLTDEMVAHMITVFDDFIASKTR